MEVSSGQPEVVRRQDYRPPDRAISRVELSFDLDPTATRVAARLSIEAAGGTRPLTLDGESLELLAISIDGRPLDASEYALTARSLTIQSPPSGAFTLETEARIAPAANTRLEGLYVSNGVFCTQCEAEGFRRITWFLDRPDVMATWHVTVRADRAACPVLLSNGNLVAEKDLGDGRHEAVWDDPFPKPSYLFALVAGDLGHLARRFATRSGRDVLLRIFVEHGNERRAEYAMGALVRSMRWDEEVYGLEYDLDLFNIVAVSDFNMGAMENKSLNVFNAKYVLADPETATDSDYAFIEKIIAHEYFHNWTGNRVTCRDWFQLSLKEGLTVFRDQQFSADQRSAPVERIREVRTLRSRQFPEDAGPLAHPVRPDSYIEINNFYTPTVYEKGAEVIRMLHARLGPEGFRKGMDLYVARHDGKAVTCDDFVAAMADANGTDLTAFARWYAQAGTPAVTASGQWDASTATYALTLAQHTDPTPGQSIKEPLPIPLRIGLIGRDGRELPLTLEGRKLDPPLLQLDAPERTFRFVGLAERPVPSLNRGFSAPIRLRMSLDEGERALLMAHDPDPFNRWEAAQQFATLTLLDRVRAIQNGESHVVPDQYLAAFRDSIKDGAADPAFRAELLALPSEDFLADQMAVVDVEAIHAARRELKSTLAGRFRADWAAVHEGARTNEPFSPDAAAAGRRALGNTALAYLAVADAAGLDLAARCYCGADNMTDRMAALAILNEHDLPAREEALADFYRRFEDDAVVLDKWLTLQAISPLPGALGRVEALLSHPRFSMRNPNKVRALIGAFASGNPLHFHAADGAGYRFFADRVIELDDLNPQTAARTLVPLGRWRRYDERRQTMMRAELERILCKPGLSSDVYEIASKSLG